MPRRSLVLRAVLLAVSLGLCAGLFLSATQAQPVKGKKYALLVGVTKYRSSKFPPLQYTENDVEELARVLRRPGSGFATVRVLTSSRGRKDARDAPTAQNVIAALKELTADRGKDDMVLIALTGHGMQLPVEDPAGKGRPKTYTFFCPEDASILDVSYTTGHSKRLVNLSWVLERLDDCDAGTKVVLMDACRNELKPELGTRSLDVRRVTIPEGVGAVFSCKAGQFSYESEKLGKGHGVFFYHVLKGLQGAADNGRGEVTLSRLVEYVTEKVPEEITTLLGPRARQTPHSIVNIPGTSPVLVRLGRAEVVRDKPPEREKVVRVKLPKEVTNSIGMKLVLVPAGTFTMGSPVSEKDRDDEHRHEVEIARAFYLGAFEVTQKQYRAVMGKNPSWFAASGGGKDLVKGKDTDDFPVETVSWEEAVEFCKRLSALAKEKGAGRIYRLPTEAEWEYACRGGASSYHVFHVGDALASTQANFNGTFPYGAADRGPHLRRTAKVGSYRPNAWGLYDMHGNVWEWCADWWGYEFYRASPRRDPQGPSSPDEKFPDRLMRGGGWDSFGRQCRSAHRHALRPDHRCNYVGFRVVLVAEEK